MPTYLVKSPLDHDQKRYKPDEEVELTEEQAAPLVAAGVVAEAVAEAPADKKKKAE